MISVAAGDFEAPLDIANAACQHMGCAQIDSFAEDSVQAKELAFRYDKVRVAELRRNVWRFSIRDAMLRPVSITSALWTAGEWDAAKTYLRGSVVVYNGVVYQAQQPIALNQEPDQNPDQWVPYFGSPMATQWLAGGNANNPQPWASGTNYAAGQNVTGSDNMLYLSNANGNLGNNPVTDGGVHWQLLGPSATGTGYEAGEVVYLNGVTYISLTNGNADNPSNTPTWVSSQVYQIGQTVLGSDLATYQSKVDFNTNINPVGDAGVHWIAQPGTQPDLMAGVNWLVLGAATLSALNILYPIGVGPTEQSETLNVFMLPIGFAREAPQVPKAGSTSFLGAPSGDAYRDWTYGDKFFTSRMVEAVRFRFAADIIYVPSMDGMFCEMLSARLAIACVERVTQSAEKLTTIEGVYKKFGDEARTINGIETGSTEPALDDFIVCRY